MKINVLTIFPEMFSPLTESMLGKAIEKGILKFNIIDIRDYSLNKHNKTDDYTFGGGQGMVFMPQPVFDAMRQIERANAESDSAKRSRNIYLSPRGRMLDKNWQVNTFMMVRSLCYVAVMRVWTSGYWIIGNLKKCQ